jgi:membrane protein YqaA with SNARE-associated domain
LSWTQRAKRLDRARQRQGRPDQIMLKKTYDALMRLSASRQAPTALAAVSFAESSFFPIPPDVMLVPMVLADRSKAWWYATIATVSSVIGGIAGYAIGFYLLELVGKPILAFYGKSDGLAAFTQAFADYGFWVLVTKGMTPIPYKVLTIAAGVAHMNLWSFIVASIIARAMRFFLVAGLLYYFGEPIRDFIEKRLILVTTVVVVSIIGGFVALKLFM